MFNLTQQRKSGLWTPNRKPPLQSRIDWSHPIVRPADGETKPSLIACYLGSEKGGPQLHDIAEIGPTGILMPGASWRADALDIDGGTANARVDLGTTAFLNTNEPFTVFAKVRLDSYVNNYPGIIRLKTNAENWEFFFSDIPGANAYGPIAFGAETTWGRFHQDLNEDGPTNKDITIAVTYNAVTNPTVIGNYRLYRDGISVAIETAAAFAVDTASSAIGIEGSNEWDGLIYFVYIFNRALLDSEVFQLSWNPFCFVEPLWPNRGALWESVVAVTAETVANTINYNGLGSMTFPAGRN